MPRQPLDHWRIEIDGDMLRIGVTSSIFGGGLFGCGIGAAWSVGTGIVMLSKAIGPAHRATGPAEIVMGLFGAFVLGLGLLFLACLVSHFLRGETHLDLDRRSRRIRRGGRDLGGLDAVVAVGIGAIHDDEGESIRTVELLRGGPGCEPIGIAGAAEIETAHEIARIVAEFLGVGVVVDPPKAKEDAPLELDEAAIAGGAYRQRPDRLTR